MPSSRGEMGLTVQTDIASDVAGLRAVMGRTVQTDIVSDVAGLRAVM